MRKMALDNIDWSFSSHFRFLIPGKMFSRPITRALGLSGSSAIDLPSTQQDCHRLDQCLYLQPANERRLYSVTLLHYFTRMNYLCIILSRLRAKKSRSQMILRYVVLSHHWESWYWAHCVHFLVLLFERDSSAKKVSTYWYSFVLRYRIVDKEGT